jgi:[acyl-carrier-protein] S-malonyltransferase
LDSLADVDALLGAKFYQPNLGPAKQYKLLPSEQNVASQPSHKISPDTLRSRMNGAALAFRGYNQTNMGRSAEFLAHPRYGKTVEEYLHRAEVACTEACHRPVRVLERVRQDQETNIDSYAEAVALIVGMELAQLRLLQEFFDIDYRKSMVSIGFSLGEIAAIVAGGILEMEGALSIPLALSEDCVALSQDVTMAIVFSREQRLPIEEVQKICLELNSEGEGTIGISTILAPNSLLLLGQGTTVERFRKRVDVAFPKQIFVRVNHGVWPPLHTCIMWQKAIPNRSAVLMQQLKFRLEKPIPPVLSLVTGKVSYERLNGLDLMHKWVDHPQRLWDVIYESLVMGVETYIHVGPEPNIIPATLNRLKDNIEGQAKANIGFRALSAAAQRRWLQAMLPQRTALMRAPSLVQVNLEDWLLEQKV